MYKMEYISKKLDMDGYAAKKVDEINVRMIS